MKRRWRFAGVRWFSYTHDEGEAVERVSDYRSSFAYTVAGAKARRWWVRRDVCGAWLRQHGRSCLPRWYRRVSGDMEFETNRTTWYPWGAHWLVGWYVAACRWSIRVLIGVGAR